MHRILSSTLFVVLLIVSLVCGAMARQPMNPGIPVVFSTGSSAPQRGQTIQCTVYMNGQVNQDTVVTLGTSNTSMVQSMPATVTVPSGQDQVTFDVTISTTGSGAFSFAATANGGSALSAEFFLLQP